jgi:hypothetical protein
VVFLASSFLVVSSIMLSLESSHLAFSAGDLAIWSAAVLSV